MERRTLNPAARDYNALAAADPEAAVEQAATLKERLFEAGVNFDGRAMSSFLRPQLLGRAVWEELRGSAVRLLGLAARDVCDGDVSRLCALLGTPAGEARWIGLDPGTPDVLLSRVDGLLTSEGPRCMEINSDAPAGFGYGDRMAEVLKELPLFRRFAAGRRAQYETCTPRVVNTVLAQWNPRSRPGVLRVAIVDWAEVKTHGDQEILCQAFVAAGRRSRGTFGRVLARMCAFGDHR